MAAAAARGSGGHAQAYPFFREEVKKILKDGQRFFCPPSLRILVPLRQMSIQHGPWEIGEEKLSFLRVGSAYGKGLVGPISAAKTL